MKLSAAVVSVVGNVRRVNQDNLYMGGEVRPLNEQDYSRTYESQDEVQVYSVCDGMGGEEAGEEASLLAVKALADYPADSIDHHWRNFIFQANELVCELCRERSIRAGTTFSGVFFNGNKCTAVNVGDSRIYFISEGAIRQISVDHTQFQTMVNAGLIEKNDKTHTRARSLLTQHFGIEKELLELEPHVEYLNNLEQGDMILLCSDGLYGNLSDPEMLSIIQSEKNLQQCCGLLVERAEAAGSRDNITAMLIRVEDESTSVFDERVNGRAVTGFTRSLHLLPIITAALGIACAALVFLFIRFSYTWPMVSDVTGQTIAKAKKTLEKSGFQVVLDGDFPEESESLQVTAQSIPGNVRAKRGSEITVSLGVFSDEMLK